MEALDVEIAVGRHLLDVAVPGPARIAPFLRAEQQLEGAAHVRSGRCRSWHPLPKLKSKLLAVVAPRGPARGEVLHDQVKLFLATCCGHQIVGSSVDGRHRLVASSWIKPQSGRLSLCCIWGVPRPGLSPPDPPSGLAITCAATVPQRETPVLDFHVVFSRLRAAWARGSLVDPSCKHRELARTSKVGFAMSCGSSWNGGQRGRDL